MAALETTVFSFTVRGNAPNVQLLVTGLCLAAALFVAAGVLALLRRWWYRHRLEDDQSPSAQLAHFRSLYESGTISQEEFERLRALLGPRLRETMGVPPANNKVADSLRESIHTRGASPPPSDDAMKPSPDSNGQPPDNPETGIRPA